MGLLDLSQGLIPLVFMSRSQKKQPSLKKSLQLKKVAVVWLQEAIFSVPKWKRRDKLNQEGRKGERDLYCSRGQCGYN